MPLEPSLLKQKLEKKNIFVLDVRQPEEYMPWHINGSVNIPGDHIMEQLATLPKDKEIVAVCAHGIRSAQVGDLLKRKGFDVQELKGGMAGWNRVYDVVSMKTPQGTSIVQIRRLGKGCISYLIGSGKRGILVDPTVHIHEYKKIAQEHRIPITTVTDSHRHSDHVSGARSIARDTKAEIFLNDKDEYAFPFNKLLDDDILECGDAEIKVLHTPGHTKGSTCLLVDKRYLLAGDTLFVRGVARPDLGNKTDEYASDLHESYRKIRNLGNVVVLPGHVETSDIHFDRLVDALSAEIMSHSVFSLSKEEFVKAVTANMPQKPPNFDIIIQINKGLMQPDIGYIEALEEGPNRCVNRL